MIITALALSPTEPAPIIVELVFYLRQPVVLSAPPGVLVDHLDGDLHSHATRRAIPQVRPEGPRRLCKPRTRRLRLVGPSIGHIAAADLQSVDRREDPVRVQLAPLHGRRHEDDNCLSLWSSHGWHTQSAYTLLKFTQNEAMIQL